MGITVRKISSISDIYCRYDSQTSRQDVYIEIDCRGETISASYNAEIGNAVPARVFHGHEQRFTVPLLTVEEMNDLLDRLAPLAERVIAGYESSWNGSSHVAVFDDDAKEALSEIEEICISISESADETNTIQEWDAGLWLQDVTIGYDGGRQVHDSNATSFLIDGFNPEIRITAETTNKQLSDFEGLIESDLDQNIVVVNLDQYLENLRSICRGNDE